MTERRQLVSAYGATFASGVAAMFYQLAWVRQLTGVTTAATVALVLVLAAFMAGLGLGAWLGGVLARRVARPLRAYAAVELGAAALFLLGMPLLSASVRVQGLLIDHGASPAAALAVQLCAVGLYLAAATTLLGMALPLLVTGVAALRRGAAYNTVYGLNTLGAVLGCLACGYVTIEAVGLDRSVVLGTACSLASALAAQRAGAGEPAREVAAAPVRGLVPRKILVAAAASGALALAAEVVWVRMLSLVILNTVYAYTQVLAAVLLGIAIAGVLAARIARRVTDGARLARIAAGALLGAAVWIGVVPLLARAFGGSDELAGLAAAGGSLKVAAVLFAILVPGSCLVALVLPLLVSATRAEDPAQALARLFAANTLGAVAGALGAGLWLLPALGLGGAQLVLALGAVVAALGLFGRAWRAWIPAAAAAGLAVLLHAQIALPEDLYALRFERGERVLELREGVTSDVLVTEDPAQHRRIWINSAWVAGTGGGHALLGHLPALAVEHLDRALGIALGTGQTFGAVLQHGARHLDCVEINPDVVALSRRWFAAFNHDLLDHDTVSVHLEDGRAFLRATREHYDLIVLEPLQAWSAGTTALYTREFYTDAKRVLSAGGVLAQWIPFYGQDTAATRAMVRTAIDVFPEGSLWLDEDDGILLLYQGAFVVPWERLDRELHAPALADLARAKHLGAGGDVLSMFLMGPRGLAAWTRDAEVIEDDRPFLEYAAARQLGTQPLAATLASTRAFLDDPAAYLPPGVDPAVATVARAAREATIVRALCPAAELAACAETLEAQLARVPGSERVHYQYRQLILGWADAVRTARAQREAIYQRGIAHEPGFGEAMVNLAVSLAERGQYQAAAEYAGRAREVPVSRARAELLLEKLRAHL